MNKELFNAIKENNEEKVEQMLKLDKLLVNAKNDNNYTALMYAVIEENVEMVKLLIKYNANPFIIIIINDNRRNALYFAEHPKNISNNDNFKIRSLLAQHSDKYIKSIKNLIN